MVWVLNVVMGGTLFQNIPTDIKHPLKHIQDAPDEGTHGIEIVEENSML